MLPCHFTAGGGSFFRLCSTIMCRVGHLLEFGPGKLRPITGPFAPVCCSSESLFRGELSELGEGVCVLGLAHYGAALLFL